jgi:hypothetical protein
VNPDPVVGTSCAFALATSTQAAAIINMAFTLFCFYRPLISGLKPKETELVSVRSCNTLAQIKRGSAKRKQNAPKTEAKRSSQDFAGPSRAAISVMSQLLIGPAWATLQRLRKSLEANGTRMFTGGPLEICT